MTAGAGKSDQLSRIVITTLGSLGDLYPYLTMGLELQRRGHDVVVATCLRHQPQIESLGLEYHQLRPDIDWLNDPAYQRRASEVQQQILGEDGGKTACDAVETLLQEVSASGHQRHGIAEW